MIGHAGPRARIIGLPGFPRDAAARDVNLPATGAGAVHTMSRADDYVVLPALPIAFLSHSLFVAQFAVAISEGLPTPRQIGVTLQKLAHLAAPIPICPKPVADACCAGSPMTGARRTSVR